MKQRGSVLVVILALIAILGIGYFAYKYYPLLTKLQNQSNPSSSPVPTASIDLTADWKTYISDKYGFSFKYPGDFKVEERAPGFFVITSPTEHTPQGGISLDARQSGSYQTLEKAQDYINTTFTVSKTETVNDWSVFNGIGKEEMLKGLKFKLAITPYQSGAIEAETIDSEPYSSLFNQILSTFKFLGTTKTESPTPQSWKVYKNEQYGFEFSYPETYKVLTDKENLYGWPKAILLLYKGGQSYDLAVEIWNTEAEYKEKYADASILTVFKTKDGKFITLLNQNKTPEVSQIITTFKFTN